MRRRCWLISREHRIATVCCEEQYRGRAQSISLIDASVKDRLKHLSLLLCQTTCCRDADAEAHHQQVEQILSAQLELSADVRNFVKMGGEITTEAMSVITGTNVPHEQVVQDGPVVEPSFSKLEKGEHVFTVRFAHSVLIAKESQEAKMEEDHCERFTKVFFKPALTKVKENTKVDWTRAGTRAI